MKLNDKMTLGQIRELIDKTAFYKAEGTLDKIEEGTITGIQFEPQDDSDFRIQLNGASYFMPGRHIALSKREAYENIIKDLEVWRDDYNEKIEKIRKLQEDCP